MKKIKFIKIIMVFVMIFYQLSPAATVLADDLVDELEDTTTEPSELNDNNLLMLNADLPGEENTLGDGLADDVADQQPAEEPKEKEKTVIPVLGEDNDDLFNEMYAGEIYFQDKYIITFAKGYLGSDKVPTINELVNGLTISDVKIAAIYADNEELDLYDEEVLNSEIKNDYEVIFTDNTGVSASYTVIVYGDNNLDNEFTEEDINLIIDDYLHEKNVPSMDVIAPIGSEEKFGTITFDDIAILNDALIGHNEIASNNDLRLSLESDVEEAYVGDTINVNVIVNSSNVNDFIDGIDGIVSTSNLELVDIIFNDNLIGGYTDEGSFAGVGRPITNENVVMTLVLVATEAGTGTIEISGNTAKYLDINEFENLVKEIEVTRKISSNANLSSLNASVGKFDLEFDKDITKYTLIVPYDTKSVILSGSLEDVNASVDGLIEYVLDGDITTANIVVTGEDGTTKTYVVTIIKEAKPEENVVKPIVYYYSSNSYLKSLQIDGFDIEFNKDIYEYKITVDSDVTSLDIKAIAEDYNSRVEITGNENFKTGENIVLITVTAEDGSTSIYKLIVDKKAPEKKTLGEVSENSNTAEKIIIIVLIVLVVLGLLYLIFKKDEEDEMPVKKEEDKVSKKEIKSEKVESKKANKNDNFNKQNVKKKK